MEKYKTRVVCLGDSITGWNNSSNYEAEWPRKTYPRMLEQNLLKKGYTLNVANEGYDGEISASAQERVKNALRKYPEAKYFFILFGTNDIYSKGIYAGPELSSENILRNLADAAKKAKEKGKVPIMMTIPHIFPDSAMPGYNRIANAANEKLENYCEKENISLVDICSKLRDEHFDDGVHPNASGARIIAEEAFKILIPLIKIYK